MRLDDCISIEDLHRTAKRRLPRVIYDFVAGGAGDEACLDRNCRGFQAVRLLPRYLVDIATRDPSAGLPGARRAIEILRGEIDLVSAQLGCPRIAELDSSWLAAQP